MTKDAGVEEMGAEKLIGHDVAAEESVRDETIGSVENGSVQKGIATDKLMELDVVEAVVKADAELEDSPPPYSNRNETSNEETVNIASHEDAISEEINYNQISEVIEQLIHRVEEQEGQ